MQNSYSQKLKTLNSILDVSIDINTAYTLILRWFDPHKALNLKTSVLDCSTGYNWAEADLQLFNVKQSRKLIGNILTNKYNLILYEPPYNKSFFNNCVESSKIFKNILEDNGVIIVKVKDFKVHEGKNNIIKGSFDTKNVFEANDLILVDHIIYKNNKIEHSATNIEIAHTNFLCFKHK